MVNLQFGAADQMLALQAVLHRKQLPRLLA